MEFISAELDIQSSVSKRMGNGNADGLSWGPSLGQIYCPPEAEEDVMK